MILENRSDRPSNVYFSSIEKPLIKNANQDCFRVLKKIKGFQLALFNKVHEKGLL